MSNNTSLIPFRVDIPQVELDDLKRRLDEQSTSLRHRASGLRVAPLGAGRIVAPVATV